MFAIRTALLSTLIPLGAAAIASWSCRDQHRSAEFIELLRLLDAEVPRTQAIHLILDPVRLHCSAEVAVYIALRPWRFRVHWLPLHASWLSFIEA